MSEKKCVCGHEMESGGYQVLELHGESLLKDYMDVELWVCPRCGRIAFFMREKNRKRPLPRRVRRQDRRGAQRAAGIAGCARAAAGRGARGAGLPRRMEGGGAAPPREGDGA